MALVQQSAVRVLLLLAYYTFNSTSQLCLNGLLLPAISSLKVTYDLVITPYQTPVVNFV
jgi:hypothetical protein